MTGRQVIHKHPVFVRLYAWGIPTWVALALAGWPLAAIVGLVAAIVVVVGWR